MAEHRARGAVALAVLSWFQGAKNQRFHHPCTGIKHRSLSSRINKGQAPRCAADNAHRAI